MLDRMSMPLARGRVAWSSLKGNSAAAASWRKVLLVAKSLAGIWWIPALLGWALGRAALFGVLTPFVTAYPIALAAQGRPRRALAAAVGAAVGAWTSLAAGGLTTLLQGLLPFLGLVVALVVARRRRRSPWVAAVAAAVAVATVRLALAPVHIGGLVPAAVTAAGELAAALTLLPVAGLAGVHPGILTHGQVISVIALTSFAVLGVQGIEWQGVSFAPLLARLLVLLAAAVGGAGFGAAAGAGLGVITFLAVPIAVSGRIPWETVVLPAGGFLAGLGALAGKPGAIAGLLVAHFLLTPLAGSGSEIGHALLFCILAAAAITLAPAALLRSFAGRLPGTPERERLHRQRLEQANTRAREQLHRVAAVFEELSQTFAQQDAVLADEAGFDRIASRVWHTVCRECSHNRVCWERHPYQTYRDLMTTVANAGPDGLLRPHDLADGLRQRCIRPPQLLRGLVAVLESTRVESYWRSRLQESRELVPRQLAGIAGIITGVADQMERGGAAVEAADGEPAWSPRFDVQVSVAQAPQGESAVCGDCFRRVELGPDRIAFILSDGMGTGPRAAAESQAAVAMLQRFLEAGFDLEFAVHTINSVLLLRSPDETYATLDACVVDLGDGTVQMLKVGAAPSFVRRGDQVEVVRAANVPVGILHHVETRVVTRRLAAGDTVVMVTDGVLEACRAKGDREEALRRLLGRMETADADRTVDTLFGRLRQRTGAAFPDDITVVAFQLTERGRRSSERGVGRFFKGRTHEGAHPRADNRNPQRSAAWAVHRLTAEAERRGAGGQLQRRSAQNGRAAGYPEHGPVAGTRHRLNGQTGHGAGCQSEAAAGEMGEPMETEPPRTLNGQRGCVPGPDPEPRPAPEPVVNTWAEPALGTARHGR